MMKQKKHRKIPALAAGTTLVAAMTLMASCSTDYEDKIVYNDIQQPFQQDFKKDTVAFDKLPAEFAKHILNLSDPSTEIVGKADYTFQTNNLISVKKSAWAIRSSSPAGVRNQSPTSPSRCIFRRLTSISPWPFSKPFLLSPVSPSSHPLLAEETYGRRKAEIS